MKTISAELQKELTPAKALELLLEGNQRFASNLRANRDLLQEVKIMGEGQFPYAVILSCIDSRLSSELIFDLGMGDVFNARIAGNIINSDIIGSMEFACKLAGAKLIMVLGHTSCGAVKGACANAQLGTLTSLLEKIKPSIEEVKNSNPWADLSKSETVNKVAEVNVLRVAEQIKKESEVLAEMIEKKEIQIVSAMYDVKTGKVELI